MRDFRTANSSPSASLCLSLPAPPASHCLNPLHSHACVNRASNPNGITSLQKKVGGGGYVSLSSQSGTTARGSGAAPPPPQAFHLLPGRVHRFRHDEVGIRSRLRTELLHAARIHFGYVEVALLIDGDAVYAPTSPRRNHPCCPRNTAGGLAGRTRASCWWSGQRSR